jgi:hypothetical protein
MKKTWLSIFCANISIIFFQINGNAQTVEVTNVNARVYQQRFNELTQKGFRPTKIKAEVQRVIDYVDGEQPQLGYWATFKVQPNSPAWAAHHGLTSAAYQEAFNRWTSQGYLPTDINIAYLNKQVSYSVIFDKLVTPVAWQARHGLSQTDFQKTNQTLAQQGFKIKIQTKCYTPRGNIYAAVWVK